MQDEEDGGNVCEYDQIEEPDDILDINFEQDIDNIETITLYQRINGNIFQRINGGLAYLSKERF